MLGFFHINWFSRGLFAAVVASVLSITSALAQPTDTTALSDLLLGYEDNLNEYIFVLTDKSWAGARVSSGTLTSASRKLRKLSEKDSAGSWRSYASNLYHHSLELEIATKKEDTREVIFLLATMFDHIGQIQAANPLWLRSQVNVQLTALKHGIERRDKKVVRRAAEIIHTSSNKIVLSAALERRVYKHVRWLSSISAVNRLGDAIIGRINEGDWSEIGAMYTEIEHTLNKWDSSFR